MNTVPDSPARFALRRFGEVDSALAVLARAEAEEGLAPFTPILVDHQTAGRGRSGRRWEDASSSILTAILVETPEHHLSWTPLLAGIAVAEALEARGPSPILKWPNDVLIDGRKVAGILCEHLGADPTTGLHRIGVGIGINLERAPESAGEGAGAIPLLDGETPSEARESILPAIITALASLLAADPSSRHEACTSRLLPFPAWTPLRLPGPPPLPILPDGLAADGALLALDARGRRLTITAGDVDLPAPTRGDRP